MIQVRKGSDRGYSKLDWLESWHTFSFGEYFDPDHKGFRKLRVLNDDIISPERGFETHAHHDMEIVTIVLTGKLEHKDSMGNGSIIQAGEVQRMSAGTGVTHSEFNPSKSEPVHLLQVWFFPEEKGIAPSYQQKAFPAEGRQGKWQMILSPDSKEGAVTLQQAVRGYRAELQPGQNLSWNNSSEKFSWIHIADGQGLANKLTVSAGDGISLAKEETVQFAAQKGPLDIVIFELA